MSGMQRGEMKGGQKSPRKDGKGFKKEGTFDFSLKGRGGDNQTKVTLWGGEGRDSSGWLERKKITGWAGAVLPADAVCTQPDR